MMLIGGFDNKTIGFSKMEEFAKGKEIIRKSKIHEKYISLILEKYPQKNSKLF